MKRLSQRQLQRLVERVIARLPSPFREHLGNVAILWAEEPSEGEDPGLLGLYEGVPLTEQGAAESFSLPQRITLFLGPLLRACRSPAELGREVGRTLLHEIGHHFGLEEAELERVEREWERGS